MTIEQTFELVNGGDWACAWGERETLARVCRELSVVLEPGLAAEAERIARQAESDLWGATRRWARLAHQLDHGVEMTADGTIAPLRRGGGASVPRTARQALILSLLAAFDS